MSPDDSIHAWPVEAGSIMVTAPTGIAYLEMFAEGDDVCRNWIEYPAENGAVQRQVLLNELELRNRLPEEKRKGVMKISVKSFGGGHLDIDDFKKLSSSKESSLKLPSGVPGLGKSAYRAKALGHSSMDGSESHEVIFASALRQDRILSRIIFYHGFALDGLEFVYDDDSRQLFGKRGGKVGGDVFEMDIRRGEYITGFHVRSGAWIDGIQVLTSLGRRSPMYGNAHGGSGHTLIPPRGYNICGVTGSCGPWLDGFSVIITK